ncbi:MAG: alpha/beta fold hydrolase [Candidatus Binatia bacterium]
MQELKVSIRNGKFTTSIQWGGSGAPLLFLHGAGGPMVGAPFLDELAKHFTVYAPAHPGFGAGQGVEHLDDIIDFALYYHDFLDELQIENPHIIGHSMGGMLAAEMTALAPYRVNRLVLVGPAGLWLDEAPIPDFFTFNPQQLFEVALHDPEGPLGQMLVEQMKNPEVMLEMYKCMASAGKFMWPIPDKGLKKRIHRIQCPTLVLWGASDKLIPPVYGDAFLKAIPGARLVTLPQAGHLPMLEQQDEFVQAVTNFLLE